MATKKQQRRRYMRAKAHGRGDDHVDVDEDGERPDRKPARAQAKQRGGARVPQPPNARRAAQKAILFAALFYLVQHFTSLGGKTSQSTQMLFSVWMFAMFWVIGMWTERWTWKRYLKQQEQARS